MTSVHRTWRFSVSPSSPTARFLRVTYDDAFTFVPCTCSLGRTFTSMLDDQSMLFCYVSFHFVQQRLQESRMATGIGAAVMNVFLAALAPFIFPFLAIYFMKLNDWPRARRRCTSKRDLTGKTALITGKVTYVSIAFYVGIPHPNTSPCQFKTFFFSIILLGQKTLTEFSLCFTPLSCGRQTYIHDLKMTRAAQVSLLQTKM